MKIRSAMQRVSTSRLDQLAQAGVFHDYSVIQLRGTSLSAYLKPCFSHHMA